MFWFSLQGACEDPKIILLFSFTWVSHIERTLEINISFGLVGGCRGPKKDLFFSLAWVGHMDRTLELEINFCFGLVCKVVVKV